jgi:6-phosphogluconolactonase
LALSPLREQIPWECVHVFWGDERCVPPDDPRSNARLARLAFLDAVPIPSGQVHSIPFAATAEESARLYEAELRSFFGDELPCFDLILLGLGENGHTASLFPGTPVLNEQKRWAAEVYVVELDMYRVTLTAPLINQSRRVIFLVSGAGKAEIVRQVAQERDPAQPASLIRPARGELDWYLDRQAAVRIKVDI